MTRPGEGSEPRLPFGLTRGRMIVISLAVILLVTLAATIPLLINWRREEIWKYSGAEVDRSVQLLYDMDRMGEFTVVSDTRQPDGRYSEHIVVRKAIDVRLWRDYERPKLPCREQIGEKYPALSEYSREKVPEGVFYCERGSFTAQGEDGGTYRHTVVLLRRGGWDYLVDLSVREENRKTYAAEIDEIINHMVLIP